MVYWLYHRQRPVFATVAPPHATDDEVRERALAQYALVPLCHSDYDPIDFITMLNEASIYRDYQRY
jgi:hypothetical protein